MLSDIERKVLRIIGNYSAGRRRMPTIKELETKTGRNQEGVKLALAALAQDEYIEWSADSPDHIELLEAWERKQVERSKGRIAYGER